MDQKTADLPQQGMTATILPVLALPVRTFHFRSKECFRSNVISIAGAPYRSERNWAASAQ